MTPEQIVEFHLDFAAATAPDFDPMLVGMQDEGVPTVVVAISGVPTPELNFVAGALLTVFPTVGTLAFVAAAYLDDQPGDEGLAGYTYGEFQRRYADGDPSIRPVLISTVVGPWPAPAVGVRMQDEDGHWQPWPIPEGGQFAPGGVIEAMQQALRVAPSARAEFMARFPAAQLGQAQLKFLLLVARLGANVIAIADDIPLAHAPFN